MDPFKLGLRNLFGVVLPGALLVLVLFYAVVSGAFALGLPVLGVRWAEGQQFLASAALFLISYLLGSLMRLNSADRVDRKSAQYNQRKYIGRVLSKAEVTQRLDEAWKALRPDPQDIGLDSFPGGVWESDQFPYPVWQFWKFKLYHPPAVYKHFWRLRSCFARREYDPGKSGKEFFNYCKTVIYHASQQLGDALVLEIQSSEALVRFYAGTYYALNVGMWTLVVLLGLQLALAKGELSFAFTNLKTLNLIATAVLIATAYVARRMIVERFRTLRLKEVDTVYDGFYLVTNRDNSEYPTAATESAQQTTGAADSFSAIAASAEYVEREKLLKEAYSRGHHPSPVTLDSLISLMKERSRRNRSLSSLYFAGAQGDHPFFLRNGRVAVGLSVLPEDSAKAGLSKRHPPAGSDLRLGRQLALRD